MENTSNNHENGNNANTLLAPVIVKPIHAKPSLFAFYFEVIKEIGLKYGYNIVLHGSMNRDLDLIAIPWNEIIGDKVLMIEEIAETLGGNILIESEDDKKRFKTKYHGRECWVVNINRTIKAKYGGMVTEFVEHTDPQYYIDISVIPAILKDTRIDEPFVY